LKPLKNRRDSLKLRLTDLGLAKGTADDQNNWRASHNEKLARLREKLRRRQQQVLQGKAKVEKMTSDLKVKYEFLEIAIREMEKSRTEHLEKLYPNLIYTQSLGLIAVSSERLHKQAMVIKQICKVFPLRRMNFDADTKDGFFGEFDLVCNTRLPRGLDPHSVPSEELGASLGYMVQLLNLVVNIVGAPALHNTGFAASSSRIWQRDSYWNARPSARSNEFPLFIPPQNFCSTGGEALSSSNFGVASMESTDTKQPRLESSGGSFNYSIASPHTIERHMDLQKGISLLKKSVACITAYCYNSLCLQVPSEASTFEAFAKVLATLSSSKEVRAAFSLKVGSSRSAKHVQQLSKSVWNVDSIMTSSSLMDSSHSMLITAKNGSSVHGTEFSDIRKMMASENLEGWDLVEHPTLPPPPSQSEDVEHWTRAMFIDANNK
jgi:hypothetical protein